MKAFKGCINEGCIAHKKIKYKDSDEFCSKCGNALSYVCAGCWKVMEDNSARYCISCLAEREQKRSQNIEKVKSGGRAAAETLGTVSAVVMTTAKNSQQLVSGIKKIGKVGTEVVKIVKK